MPDGAMESSTKTLSQLDPERMAHAREVLLESGLWRESTAILRVLVRFETVLRAASQVVRGWKPENAAVFLHGVVYGAIAEHGPLDREGWSAYDVADVADGGSFVVRDVIDHCDGDFDVNRYAVEVCGLGDDWREMPLDA